MNDTTKLDAMKPLVDEWIRSRGTSMNGEAYAAALELAAHAAASIAANGAEPIYQTRWSNPKTIWGDVEKEVYDSYEKFGYAERRIVYAAPVADSAASFALRMLVAAGHVTQAKVDEALAIAAKMPGVGDSAMAKDAERYRYLRHFTRGQSTFGGISTGTSPRTQWFEFPTVVPLGNVMRGAVSQHLDEAIDAAIAASAEKGDAE